MMTLNLFMNQLKQGFSKMLNTYQYGTKYQMIQKRLEESSETKTKPIGVYMKNFMYLTVWLMVAANTGCLIYMVLWAEALRKGWLV